MRHPERRVNVAVLQTMSEEVHATGPEATGPDSLGSGAPGAPGSDAQGASGSDARGVLGSDARGASGSGILGREPWTGPQPDRAEAADILGCFRLILGRLPNREEWPGHAMQVGEPLEGVVASYVKSLEFSRRGLLEPSTLGRVELARLPGFSIYTQGEDMAVGRHVRADDYEPDVSALFRARLRPGDHVLDLGANIGYFSMLSASLVGPGGSVIAVEPNPSNARLLEASRRANGFDNVLVVQVAAGLSPGLLVLNRSHSNGTTSVVPGDVASLLDAETVGCVRADTVVPPNRRISLIKADVEGAEYLALGGCTATIRRDRPLIVTEFSPSLMPGISGISGPAYLDWLVGLGYRLGVVEADGSARPATPDAVMREHAARGTDHLDLLAEPVAGGGAVASRIGRGLGSRLGRRLLRRAA